MRSHKSPSFVERPNAVTSYNKKYYSTEEVMQILKNTISQKLNKLYQ